MTSNPPVPSEVPPAQLKDACPDGGPCLNSQLACDNLPTPPQPPSIKVLYQLVSRTWRGTAAPLGQIWTKGQMGAGCWLQEARLEHSAGPTTVGTSPSVDVAQPGRARAGLPQCAIQ